ncbi:MAG: M48 family metallopeptidase [Phycisphaerae bacterium]|nr:M48 family metallopeptidase [Phycisphaerae bacterium]
MTTALLGEVTYGARVIAYAINRGARSRARLVVSPLGAVEVRVPDDYPEVQISELVKRRSSWIAKQQDYFERYRPRELPRRYISGESLRYLGRQYRLRITKSDSDNVQLRGRTLQISLVMPETAREIVIRWLRRRAQIVLAERLMHCVATAHRHGVREGPVQIRMMQRRWGSCTAMGTISLNPKLVQTPVDCIDYVILHELCHRRHPNHGTRFCRLLDIMLPDWRARKQRLDSLALPDW